MIRTQRMNDASLTSGQNGWYERGQVLGLDCFKHGQAVKGYFSSSFPGGWDDVWYRVSDGYFVADVDIETGSSNPITGQCPVPFDTTSTPTVTGATTVGSTVTADPGQWSPAAQFSFQWNINGQATAGATSQSWLLPPETFGKTLSVTITGSSDGRNTTSTTSTQPITVSPGTLASALPTLTGSPTVGQTVTANPGSWQPAPVAFTYTWMRDGIPVPGSTAAAYLLTSADAGKQLSVKVVGTKTGYSASSRSSTPVTIARPLTSTPVPTIAGTPRVGATLTATAGAWAPAPVTLAYQWMRGSTAIAGATSATYTLVNADAGQAITVRIIGSKPGYAPTTKTSAPATIEKLLSPIPVPTISGTPTVGQTVTAVPGSWGPAPVTLSYQWLRGGTVITGATATTYKLTAMDADKNVSVQVTGAKPGYTTTSKVSASLAVKRQLTATPTPTITGTARVGSTLTAIPGAWAPAPVTLSYQWLRAGAPIAGATTSSYTLTTADAGKSITLSVSGSKVGYTTALATSLAKSVENILSPTATPRITGSPTVGQTLTALPGVWGPAPVTFTYQWLRNGSAISSATVSTYKVVAADAGAKITVTVTGSKPGYTTVAFTSPAVDAQKALTSTPKPTITGTPRVASSLTAVPGTWAPAPVTLKCQWYRNAAAIAGATSTTYVLTDADATASITVRVNGSKLGYTSVATTSAALTVEPTTLSSSVPSISGNGSAGSTLSADAGAWGPAPVQLGYQWFVNGGPVGGATGSTFVVPTWAAGTSVTVTVTGSKPGYISASQTSGQLSISMGIGDRLRRGEVMLVDSFLTSPNGQYRFVLQSDGNAVIVGPGGPIWGSHSDGNSVNPLAFQDDGNIVLYRTDGRAVWSTFTNGKPARELVMQDDGNLVLYGDGGYFWSSGTTQGGGGGARFKLPFPAGASYRITQGPAEHAAGLYPAYNKNATDFGMPVGSRVVASAAGTVYSEGYDSTGAIEIRIDHGDNLCTQYVHLNRTVINRGQQVAQGQWIGDSGNTGISTGPHLHWNIVYCNTGISRETPNTVENGTSYPAGSIATSQNG
ncbi:hypothetical protein GCM10009563_23740 [Subtercola frigoramans]